MKNIILFTSICLLAFSFIQGSFIGSGLDIAQAQEQEDWKLEYADICSKTQNAMTLSADELKGLVDRCDKLQERLDELNGSEGKTERKVYTKRLKMCRDLYQFTLEYKEK